MSVPSAFILRRARIPKEGVKRMNDHSRGLPVLILATTCLLLLISPFAVGQSGEANIGESILDKATTYINQAANRLGEWMVKAANEIVGRDVASGLEVPLGYLGVLTAALFAFSVIQVARKVIWLIVVVGWALLILRIVLEVLSGPVEP